MAGSEMRGSDSGRSVEADIARYADQASVELSAAQASETEGEPKRARRSYGTVSAADRSRLIKEARETDFPIALRGYERNAVDRYVVEVSRLITELEMTASPESAVRHALEEVSEETRGLLERAHQTAEDITARSRARADDRLRQVEAEAEELRKSASVDAEATREAGQREADAMRDAAQREAHDLRAAAQEESASMREMATREVGELRDTATREVNELREAAVRDAQETRTTAREESDRLLSEARRESKELLDEAEGRVRELAQSAETIWRERRRLVDDMRAIGEQLSSIGEAEARRFPQLSEAIPPAAVPSRADKGSGPATEPATSGVSEPLASSANGGGGQEVAASGESTAPGT
jgi:uncharacterized protein YoxC